MYTTKAFQRRNCNVKNDIAVSQNSSIKVTLKVEPSPSLLFMLIRPLWASTICLVIDKPKPVPPESLLLALSTL